MNDKNFKLTKTPGSMDSYYQERLRQARVSFNLALIATAASAGISFTGVALLFTGNMPAGGTTTAGGITFSTVSARWLKLAKDANDRLDSAARGQ
jgi:hypothetical protein